MCLSDISGMHRAGVRTDCNTHTITKLIRVSLLLNAFSISPAYCVIAEWVLLTMSLICKYDTGPHLRVNSWGLIRLDMGYPIVFSSPTKFGFLPSVGKVEPESVTHFPKKGKTELITDTNQFFDFFQLWTCLSWNRLLTDNSWSELTMADPRQCWELPWWGYLIV